jgi:hypothetical protein
MKVVALLYKWKYIAGNCYGLSLKCSPKAHVLKAWIPAAGLSGSDWIMKAQLTNELINPS